MVGTKKNKKKQDTMAKKADGAVAAVSEVEMRSATTNISSNAAAAASPPACDNARSRDSDDEDDGRDSNIYDSDGSSDGDGDSGTSDGDSDSDASSFSSESSSVDNPQVESTATSKSTKSSRHAGDAKRHSSSLDKVERWISSLAIFGDSPWALGMSFVLLLVSIGFSHYLTTNTTTTTLAGVRDTIHHQMPSTTSARGRRKNTAARTNDEHDENDDDGVDSLLYEKLGPIPSIDPPHIYDVRSRRDSTQRGMGGDDGSNSIVDAEMIEAYRKDGVIAIRGLVDDELLSKLDIESDVLVKEQQKMVDIGKKRRGNQFHTENHGTLFINPPRTEFVSHYRNDNVTGFLELAVLSDVPRVAAELMLAVEDPSMSTNDDSASVRVLRDIFLAKDDDPFICGYHVDDLGFWPSTPESVGVNAWVALDDMTDEDLGGNFAVAVGSHVAEWRDEAHRVTGASTHFPPGGYSNASDLLRRRTGSGTCNLKRAAPHLHKRMEETRRVYMVRRGDVIFHTRWLFHRTVAFNQSRLESLGTALDEQNGETKSKAKLVHRRYSIRYGPGTSVIPPGYGTELSVLWDEKNGGRTADEVSAEDGPWYPKVFPSASAEEINGLARLVDEKLPKAISVRRARQAEMKPLLRQLAKQRLRPSP